MVLKKTVEQLKSYLLEISHDLEKAGRGNRAAAQRVRTNTIKFAKLAKQYRKESIQEGRKGKRKSSGRAVKKKAVKKTARRKPAKRGAAKRTTARRKTTRRKTTRKTARRK